MIRTSELTNQEIVYIVDLCVCFGGGVEVAERLHFHRCVCSGEEDKTKGKFMFMENPGGKNKEFYLCWNVATLL